MPSTNPTPLDPSGQLEISVLSSFSDIEADEWDTVVPPDDPFCTHAFLSCLEASGSACAETGWMSAPVVVREAGGGRLLAAAPAYVKSHSYGEYIFDWGWAQASERARIPYYPKVLCAVPFTPATGRRLLVHPSLSNDLLEPALMSGLRHLADAARASGVHLLFVSEAEHDRIPAHDAHYIPRLTRQFHWTNNQYTSFDDWTSNFRAKCRKETRRERRRVAELGATLHVLRGDEILPAHWGALEEFYRSTCDRKWGEAYLHPEFFSLAPDMLGDMAIALVAEVDGDFVAGALAFHRGAHLYGRYWGCRAGFESLHFEICYHRPIELCIEHGWTRFEAGAQGNHKLRRGLMPSATWSAHWLRHQGLAKAVRQAVLDEALVTTEEMAVLHGHGPFRRDTADLSDSPC